jgi:hypothetical protein
VLVWPREITDAPVPEFHVPDLDLRVQAATLATIPHGEGRSVSGTGRA